MQNIKIKHIQDAHDFFNKHTYKYICLISNGGGAQIRLFRCDGCRSWAYAYGSVAFSFDDEDSDIMLDLMKCADEVPDKYRNELIRFVDKATKRRCVDGPAIDGFRTFNYKH